ncbi:MAG: hypothetical protein OXT09_33590 [Myxococcales bacterium]|nr:hypothetical protein [Myxococcales bacterium]
MPRVWAPAVGGPGPRYRSTVARYFRVTLDDSDDAFLQVASRHPVFELVELGSDPLV